ncbi:TraR/DksA family transcriptional regulator, partial [Planctomycetota bacterium]
RRWASVCFFRRATMSGTAAGLRRSEATASRRDQYADLRKLLLKQREELLEQIDGGLADSRPDRLGARFDDVADRASDAFYNELAQEVAEIATTDLRKIDRALEKIDDKTYGKCEDCGKTIPKARLETLPFADLCVRCQQEFEDESAADHYGSLSPHGRN